MKSVGLLYGALGRQVDDHVVEGWDCVLARRTDYQVEQGTQFLLQTWRRDHPPTAYDLCDTAGNYAVSEEAARALKLARPPAECDPESIAEAMAGQCRKNIAAGRNIEFYRNLLRTFENSQSPESVTPQRRCPASAMGA